MGWVYGLGLLINGFGKEPVFYWVIFYGVKDGNLSGTIAQQQGCS